MEQIKHNPLSQYFRQIKQYIKLPSGTSYYPPGVIKFTESGEVGILPMTGKDELILKNPDALLNGEAIVEVLKSCVPAVSDPRLLLINDIDALITAVRYATFGDSLETELACPACNHMNLFKLNLRYSLDHMTYLEPEYVINLPSGLSIFIKPYGFPDLLKGLHAQFEQNKLQRSLENANTSDEQRLKVLSTAFKEMSITTYALICNSITKIVDESRNINVSDKEFIKEFLNNVEKPTIDQISALIEEINQIGIRRTFSATCTKCTHQWESEIDFNPVNFSYGP